MTTTLSDQLRALSQKLKEQKCHQRWMDQSGDTIGEVDSEHLLARAAALLDIGPAEERGAWDQFVAGYLAGRAGDDSPEVLQYAEHGAAAMLDARRKKFGFNPPPGSIKPAPKPPIALEIHPRSPRRPGGGQ